MKHLWEAEHPYHANEGCYYVSRLLGHHQVDHSRGPVTYDGKPCHLEYASWEDFKANRRVPYTKEERELRRQNGINDDRLDEDARRWKEHTGDDGSFLNADMDYNLLYRWDWVIADPNDYEKGEPVPGPQLKLFYMFQRKALPTSVTVRNMTPEDESEVREFLQRNWKHMQELWAPFSGSR